MFAIVRRIIGEYSSSRSSRRRVGINRSALDSQIECLEARRLLSAHVCSAAPDQVAHPAVSAEVAVHAQHATAAARKPTTANFAGTWTTEAQGFAGTLALKQHAKSVTGTLTVESFPPLKVHGTVTGHHLKGTFNITAPNPQDGTKLKIKGSFDAVLDDPQDFHGTIKATANRQSFNIPFTGTM